MSNGNNVFNWVHFIDLANSLLNYGDSNLIEASYRASISRAYYGAFCMARNVASKKGWINIKNSSEDHKLVKNYYKDRKDNTRKQIGINLDRLHKARKGADYEDICANPDKTALKCVRQAQDIKNKLLTL